MKIDKVKINNFGNISNKEIELDNNINIIYGENESGKSTFLKCIVANLYGIQKKKGKKDISDHERYMPWSGDDYSSKIKYSLDNNEQYEVFNDFKKRKAQVFDKRLEDVTSKYSISKTNGNEFFYEQTNISSEVFLSSLVVGQQEVKLGQNEQNIIIQKIANLIDTGDDTVSYEKAYDNIKKRQLEEVGSKNSKGKPINNVDNQILKLQEKKNELIYLKNHKNEFEEQKLYSTNKIEELICEKEILLELKQLLEKEHIENQKIDINNNLIKENIKNIDVLNNQLNILNTKYNVEIKTINDNYKIKQEKIEIEKNNLILEKNKKEDEEEKRNNTQYENQTFEKNNLDELQNNKNLNDSLNSNEEISEEKAKLNVFKIINLSLFILMIFSIFEIMFTKDIQIKNLLYIAIPLLFIVFLISFFLNIYLEKNKISELKRKREIENIRKEENARIKKLEEEKRAQEIEFEKELYEKELKLKVKQYQEDFNKKIQVIKDKENDLKNQFENDNNQIDNKCNYEINNIKGKIEQSQKNNNDLETEINNIKENIMKSNVSNKKDIKERYYDKLESDQINYFLEKIENNIINYSNIDSNMQNTQNLLNEEKIKLNIIEKNNIDADEKLDFLNRIEEKLKNLEYEKNELEELNDVMEMTKEVLTIAYEEMKSMVSPKFCTNISKNISNITSGKYTNIKVNDQEGLLIEIEDGRIIPMSRLSVGTIDALYLSLRLSILEELSNENMPIILDETFAYFDNKRLFNIINYLASNYKDKQIIIFTCTDREINILNNENIKYKLITL